MRLEQKATQYKKARGIEGSPQQYAHTITGPDGEVRTRLRT